MDKSARRNRRKKSIRKKVFGTTDRPRMCINKSNKNIFVQIVDDTAGKTLCGLSTLSMSKSGEKAITRKNIKFASWLGENIAKTAVKSGITKIVFDRAGYRYHGVVKTVAETARQHGLQF
ncbi:MAG: 50S ribosomal protein L18 [Candidatus Omnitrophota bacterium]